MRFTHGWMTGSRPVRPALPTRLVYTNFMSRRTRRVLACAIAAVAAQIVVAASYPGTRAPQRGIAGVRTARSSVTRPATIADLKEINYYPANGGWTYMWTRFHAAEVNRDFARMHALGANTVRIIVQADVFGFPTVKPRMAQRLKTVFALAGKHHLRVHLTLFDWWRDYGDMAGSKRWVYSLLAPYRNDKRLWIVEVRNELDASNGQQVRWARQIIPYVRALLPAAVVTVSCASITPRQFGAFVAKLRSARPTVWDYHYYGSPRFLYATLARVKAIAGSTPLIIGETGQSTSDRGGDVNALDESQAAYYRIAFAATRALNLPDPSPWILSDFAAGAIPPSRTADDNREYGYGLYRTDGTPKPAARVVSAAFHGHIAATIDGGFGHESIRAGATVAGAWRVNLPDVAEFAVDHVTTRSSAASVRIANSGGSLANPPAWYATPVQPVLPGGRWTASAFVRGHATTGGTRVALAWYDEAHRLLSQSVSAMLPASSSGWTRLTATGAAPQNARSVLVVLESWDNDGTAWFDDVQARPGRIAPLR